MAYEIQIFNKISHIGFDWTLSFVLDFMRVWNNLIALAHGQKTRPSVLPVEHSTILKLDYHKSYIDLWAATLEVMFEHNFKPVWKLQATESTWRFRFEGRASCSFESDLQTEAMVEMYSMIQFLV